MKQDEECTARAKEAAFRQVEIQQGGNEKLLNHTQSPLGGFISIKVAAVFALMLTMLGANPAVAQESGEDGLAMIYHVYNKGEYLGAVSDPEPIKQIVEEKIADQKQAFEALRLDTSEEFSVVPEQVFEPAVKDEQAVAEVLSEQLAVEAVAFALVVDGKETVYLKDKTDYDAVLDRVKSSFVSAEEMKRWEQEKGLEELPELAPGETRILDLFISAKISGLTKQVAPEKVMTVDEAVDHLLNETKVDVVAKKQRKIGKAISHGKKEQSSENLYIGETKVSQNGKDGKRELTYAITETNGKQSGRTEIGNEVTAEPVEEIKLIGTKQLPSVGTGVFIWPAQGGYISSKQGMRWGAMHKGIDIARPSGFDIKAADHGIVRAAGADGSFGNRVIIDHQNGYETIYAHLASIDVKPGQVVQKGAKIGVMGTTGRSTGIHLHFEISLNGALKNPLDYISQ